MDNRERRPNVGSIDDLKARNAFGTWMIKQLERDSDPDAPIVRQELIEQQRELNKILVDKIRQQRKANGEPEPPAQTVNLKPLSAVAKTPTLNTMNLDELVEHLKANGLTDVKITVRSKNDV